MRHPVSPTSPLSISDYDDDEIQLDFDKIYEAEIWNGKLKNRGKNPLLSQGSMETTKAQRKQENIALPEEATSRGIPDKDDSFPAEEYFCDVLEMEFESEETSKEILNNNILIDVGSVSGKLVQQETDENLAPISQYVDISGYTHANLHAQEEINAEKVTVKVVERDKVCKKSENTGYHVKRGNWMTIKLEYDDKDVSGDIHCLAQLQRTSPDSQDLPVNVVCGKHVSKSNSLPNHVLQTRATSGNYYPGSDKTNSPVVEIVNPEHKTLEYKFVCFDTCQTNAEVEKLKEKDRDMNLVLTLLHEWNGAGYKIFARKHVSLWIKATINERDLGKQIRREEKGGRKANKRSASPIEEEDETMKRKYLKFLQDNNYTHDDIDRVMKPKSKKPGQKKVSKYKKPKKTSAHGAAGCLKKPLAPVTDSTLETEDSVNTDPMKCFENELGNAVFLIID